MAVCQEALAKVGTEKPCASGYKNSHLKPREAFPWANS